MKRLTVDGKEYTIEFNIEATLYNECTEKVMDLFLSAGMAKGEAENAIAKDENEEDTVNMKSVEKALRRTVSSMADVPQKALTLFYAGLLEHHGTDSGDGTVKSIKDAKRLLVTYLREHSEENDGKGKNLLDVMNEMMEQMIEDNFFEKIGLDKMMESMTGETEKAVKTPQDHKKKSKVGNN